MPILVKKPIIGISKFKIMFIKCVSWSLVPTVKSFYNKNKTHRHISAVKYSVALCHSDLCKYNAGTSKLRPTGRMRPVKLF